MSHVFSKRYSIAPRSECFLINSEEMIDKSGKTKTGTATAAPTVVMKPSKAAMLVDKNSRTIVKIMQMQEHLSESDKDKDKPLLRKICSVLPLFLNCQVLIEVVCLAHLQERLNRRLLKLSRWIDTRLEKSATDGTKRGSFIPGRFGTINR